MEPPIPVYVESGAKRVFAGALDWPGWCRSGRDENGALGALIAYGPRYLAALGSGGAEFTPPADVSALAVVERLVGDAGTDFGAPTRSPAGDERPVDGAAAERLGAILAASWSAFDRAAEAAVGVVLRKGPRGGGRELDAIVTHVLEAERAYLRSIGGAYRTPSGTDGAAEMSGVREAVLEALSARIRGEPLPVSGRRSGVVWTPWYFVRRSAWHALDHAWEIEGRATPPSDPAA